MIVELKNKRLKSLSEVTEFHPLLNTLLEKLPSVIRVDYTHGPTELGADFIITKQDSIFCENEYVGVIVKVGKIHQDFTDIERQIDECCMERVLQGGKKKIFVTEIWIINNDAITENAKEKIHYKYKDKKIKFLSGSALRPLIDKHVPNFWYDCSLMIGNYLNNLKIKNDEIENSLSLLPTKKANFYIEQDIVKKANNYKKKKIKEKIEKIDIHKLIQNEKVILIEGSMGAGKSKLLRRLIDFYSSGLNYNEYKIIPIYISYKQLIEDFACDTNKLIVAQVEQEIFSSLDNSHKFLILIDAVDEKNFSTTEHLKNIQNLLDQVNADERQRAIITTRPINFLDEEEELLLEIPIYELCPLSLNKIIGFLEETCAKINMPKRMFNDLKKSVLIKQLPRTPIAAILLANLFDENSVDLPSNITELYKKYVELMLGRWDIEKKLQSQREYEVADIFLMLLAKFFIDNDLISMSMSEAKEMLSTYLKKRNFEIKADDLFEKIMDRAGILGQDTKQGIIFFKHKTFAEFLYAKECYTSRSLAIDSRVYDFFWQTIYFFYLGLIKDCPDELTAILNLKPTNEGERWLRVINLANYLLAGFATPYEIVEKNLYKIFVEAATLNVEIRTGKIKSPFKMISDLQLLWILAAFMRQNYSFDFFMKSIEEVNLRIDCEIHDPEIKARALFFVAVVSADMKLADPFNYIIEKYKDEIPLSIKHAIRYETQEKGMQNDIVKKFLKKFTNSLKTSRFLREQSKTLHDKPLELTMDSKD